MQFVDAWTQIGSVLLGIVVMACVSAFKTAIGVAAYNKQSSSGVSSAGLPKNIGKFTPITMHVVNAQDAVPPVVEEQSAFDKQQVQSGSDRVYTRVTEKPVEESINLRQGNIFGIQTGGHAVDGSGAPDTRGIMEKAADTLTGNRYDDRTGRPL